ncbi:MAG: hypothetical protein WBQ17_10330 [Rhizomicrobium sp.]
MVIPYQNRERLRRFCVEAANVLEDAHEPVMQGQSVSASARRYRSIVNRLRIAAANLLRIADAVERNLDSNGRRRQ